MLSENHSALRKDLAQGLTWMGCTLYRFYSTITYYQIISIWSFNRFWICVNIIKLYLISFKEKTVTCSSLSHQTRDCSHHDNCVWQTALLSPHGFVVVDNTRPASSDHATAIIEWAHIFVSVCRWSTLLVSGDHITFILAYLPCYTWWFFGWWCDWCPDWKSISTCNIHLLYNFQLRVSVPIISLIFLIHLHLVWLGMPKQKKVSLLVTSCIFILHVFCLNNIHTYNFNVEILIIFTNF